MADKKEMGEDQSITEEIEGAAPKSHRIEADPNKLKAMQAAQAKIEKTFGKGSLMNMASQEVQPIEAIPTGSLTLDLALGIGGYPRGRIVEIYGPESSLSLIHISEPTRH